MRIFKVRISPLFGQKDNGEPTVVGSWMCLVVAGGAKDVGRVLRSHLPGLFDSGDGFDIDFERRVEVGHKAYSVSIGPDGRATSHLIIVVDGNDLKTSIIGYLSDMPNVMKYADMDLYEAKEIDMTKEGVW